MLTPQEIETFYRDGYVVARGLFSEAEVAFYRAHFMSLREGQQHPGDFAGVPIEKIVGNSAKTGDLLYDDKPDPLKQYPRMIHMHRWDDVSLQWLISQRINEDLTALLKGIEPFAVQTMLYFKPPGARGQALHQDQYYLKVQPGTCMAAWLALDDCDEANGCLQAVPGSQNWDILCTVKADTTQSFTDVTVPLPEGEHAVPVIMKAGDVMFFNGQLVHGSFANTTTDRFRRSLIGHYIVGDAQKVAEFYHPVLRMDGSEVELDISVGGGSCGVWVDRNGEQVLEMQAKVGPAGPEHE
ncbi:MAG TPA: phytanoyl-CoA dioxygenase family protein [Phototrophicaceae bacterium]|nr:phytanoyl-CoA dioxygenase family protein [Phototrophicaceae bacterium]